MSSVCAGLRPIVWMRFVAMVIALLLPFVVRPLSAQQPEPEMKAAIPDADAQKKTLDEIKGIFAENYAKAKKPDDKTALGRTLAKQASEVKDDAVARYILLNEALRFAVEGADTDTALESIESLAAGYQVDDCWA